MRLNRPAVARVFQEACDWLGAILLACHESDESTWFGWKLFLSLESSDSTRDGREHKANSSKVFRSIPKPYSTIVEHTKTIIHRN